MTVTGRKERQMTVGKGCMGVRTITVEPEISKQDSHGSTDSSEER
jgi:hypothetical protein